MCSQPCASSGVGANNGSVEDARGLASGGNALRTAVAELSTLKQGQLLKRSTSLGVAQRDESKRQKRRHHLLEDCRLALEAQQPTVLQLCRRSGCALGQFSSRFGSSSLALSLNQLRARATSLGVAHRDESKRTKTSAQLKEDCRLALEAQQSEVQQEDQRSRSALDDSGSSCVRESILSAVPACGQEVERTTMVSGYAGASMHTASTAEQLSTLNLVQLRARATTLGVACRDNKLRRIVGYKLEEDCRLALQAQQSQVASAFRNSADQAPVSKRPASRMCSQPHASSGFGANNGSSEDAQGIESGGNYVRAAIAQLSELMWVELRLRATSLGVAHSDESKRQKTRNQLMEDCRFTLEVQQSEIQQEARRSGSAINVGGSSFAGVSSLSAAPACGQDAERTTTVSGYASANINAALTATNIDAQGFAAGGNALEAAVARCNEHHHSHISVSANALRAAIARLSALTRTQLEAKATSVGVVHRDSKTRKTRRQLEKDCRLALEALQSKVQQEGRRCGHALGAPVAKSPALSLNQLRARATSLGVAHRDESKRMKTSAQLKEDCRLALEAQQSEVRQEDRRSRSALDGSGSSCARESILSPGTACGQDAERTKMVRGYPSDRLHTASPSTNCDAQGHAGDGNALGASVTELSQLNQDQLRARATSLGVSRTDGSKRQKRRHQLEEDCRLALEAQQSEVQQEDRRSRFALDGSGSSCAQKPCFR